MDFNFFDILLLIILIVSSISGTYLGFIKLSLNLIAIIFSIIFGYFLYPFAYEFLLNYINKEILLISCSGLLSYIIALLVCLTLNSILTDMVEKIRGGALDRIAGLLCGIARGVIIGFGIFMILAVFFSGSYNKSKKLGEVINATTFKHYPIWLQQAFITRYFDQLKSITISIIPQHFLDLNISPKQDNVNTILDSH